VSSHCGSSLACPEASPLPSRIDTRYDRHLGSSMDHFTSYEQSDAATDKRIHFVHSATLGSLNHKHASCRLLCKGQRHQVRPSTSLYINSKPYSSSHQYLNRQQLSLQARRLLASCSVLGRDLPVAEAAPKTRTCMCREKATMFSLPLRRFQDCYRG